MLNSAFPVYHRPSLPWLLIVLPFPGIARYSWIYGLGGIRREGYSGVTEWRCGLANGRQAWLCYLQYNDGLYGLRHKPPVHVRSKGAFGRRHRGKVSAHLTHRNSDAPWKPKNRQKNPRRSGKMEREETVFQIWPGMAAQAARRKPYTDWRRRRATAPSRPRPARNMA